jgi:hypothetical protein
MSNFKKIQIKNNLSGIRGYYLLLLAIPAMKEILSGGGSTDVIRLALSLCLRDALRTSLRTIPNFGPSGSALNHSHVHCINVTLYKLVFYYDSKSVQ